MKVILKNNVQDVLYCRFTSCRALCSTPGRLVHLIPTKREGRWDRRELFTIRDKNCQWSLFLDPLFKGILSGPEDATDNTFTLHLFLGMSPFNAPAHPGVGLYSLGHARTSPFSGDPERGAPEEATRC